MHPLVTQPPEAMLLMPPRLLPPAGYYALLAQYPRAVIDWSGRYNRAEKSTHRFEIADTRGRLSLTVPIAKPSGGARWADVTLSDHGRWQETMPTALESAYGRTPFFEFYADCLLPLVAKARGGDSLMAFAASLDAAVRCILGLPESSVTHTASLPPEAAEASHDARTVCHHCGCYPVIAPYWQVRVHSLGFIPSLSVLDIIFNLGPEAPLHLRSINKT